MVTGSLYGFAASSGASLRVPEGIFDVRRALGFGALGFGILGFWVVVFFCFGASWGLRFLHFGVVSSSGMGFQGVWSWVLGI